MFAESSLVVFHKMKSRAIRIVSIENDACQLHAEELKLLLLDERIVNKKVAFLSVAGAFRMGKSFLLNVFLHYLRAHKNGSPPSGSSWLDDISPSDGFSWRGGEERDTIGILLWNEPFFLRDSTGEEFVLFLMDTQGTFDHETTIKGCATIFGISTLTSAFQIYNLSARIQENDLQNLGLFTEYGKIALESNVTPFQTLMFLIRDSNDVERDGFLEGKAYLRRTLEKTGKHQELQDVRKHIDKCFSKMLCFLLPHPGGAVARWKGGSFPVMEDEFRRMIMDLTRRVFQNLSPKTHNDCDVTCGQLCHLIEGYVKIFSSSDMPTPKSMADATARMSHESALQTARDVYERHVSQVWRGENASVAKDLLEKYHSSAKAKAVSTFEDTKRMGADTYGGKYLKRLEKEIEEQYLIVLNENARREKEELAEAELLRMEKENEKQEEQLRLQYEKERKLLEEKAMIEKRLADEKHARELDRVAAENEKKGKQEATEAAKKERENKFRVWANKQFKKDNGRDTEESGVGFSDSGTLYAYFVTKFLWLKVLPYKEDSNGQWITLPTSEHTTWEGVHDRIAEVRNS